MRLCGVWVCVGCCCERVELLVFVGCCLLLLAPDCRLMRVLSVGCRWALPRVVCLPWCDGCCLSVVACCLLFCVYWLSCVVCRGLLFNCCVMRGVWCVVCVVRCVSFVVWPLVVLFDV